MSASLAQSVEHAAVNRSVNGSSPLGSAIFLFFEINKKDSSYLIAYILNF